MAETVDGRFTKAMPKAELHAHLTGSISPETLHEIRLRKQSEGLCQSLASPLDALPNDGRLVNVVSFFPIFDKYIYELINDAETVEYATRKVIDAFADDGVAYLELRTTPRANAATGLTKARYVEAVHKVISKYNAEADRRLDVRLILSIDRRMSAEQAEEVVDLAVKYQHMENTAACASFSGADQLVTSAGRTPGYTVAIDLCGNPMKGHVSLFGPAFQRAKKQGLGVTVHFAEVPESSTGTELETLLSWHPDRLGHAINIPPEHKRTIVERQLGLELCLSCNVLAGLTTGGFAMHHFGEWRTQCPIALSTDDVGIFRSPLSNEYLLAAQYFELNADEVIGLAKSAVSTAFSGRQRMLELIRVFEDRHKNS